MASAEMARMECENLSACAQVMSAGPPSLGPEAGEGLQSRSGRLNFDVNGAKNGLGQLVLTLVKLLHELLERQAIRRVDAGSLTDRADRKAGTGPHAASPGNRTAPEGIRPGRRGPQPRSRPARKASIRKHYGTTASAIAFG